MDYQLIIVIALVATAAAYLLRQTWRTWVFKKGRCGGSCGCAHKRVQEANGNSTLIPVDQIMLRGRRDGQRKSI